jgi:2,5-dihydroxypyridine 5,6-dioxygenase
MPVGDSELLDMFEHVLRLSKVDETQGVAVLKCVNSNPRLVWAAMTAADRLGAKVYGVELPATNNLRQIGFDPTGYVGETSLSGHEPAKQALLAADLIIDTMLLLHSPEQTEILSKGKRMLLVIEPPEILARLLPTEDDKRRVMAGVKKLEAGKTFKVTSKAGTQFEASLGQYPVIPEYGFCESPGRWDHWPSGFLFTWPTEGTSNGTIVIDRGDILLPFKTYAQSPITLEIRDGYIRNIRGEFDAEHLESYYESFHDPEVYAISHIGWGLQPRAKWSAQLLHDRAESVGIDARAYYGNFLFSTGPNTEAGGTRNTACHMDIPLRNCTVLVDGEAMVRDGDVIPDDQAVCGRKIHLSAE